MLTKHHATLAFSSVIASFALHAAPATHFIITTECLAHKFPTTVVAHDKQLKLLKLSTSEFKQLMMLKDQQHNACGGFFNVTEQMQQATLSAQRYQQVLHSYQLAAQPAFNLSGFEVRYRPQVESLLKTFNAQNLWDQLTQLTNFENRNANRATGKEAAEWIKGQVIALAEQNHRTDVSAEFITNPGYLQPSLVVKMGNSDKPGIVLGAHMDTTSWFSRRQPGADDDGSGSATVLEAARVLMSSPYTFDKPIYFMWYAAEEQGLIGSQKVVATFKSRHTPVAAVLHMDMTGYQYQKDSTLWLLTDNVDTNLTKVLATLIDTYIHQPVDYTHCGYACSDHASWTQQGYPSAIAFESSFGHDNPNIHSANDTMDKLSLEHMSDFTKLAIAFAVELAEPVTN